MVESKQGSLKRALMNVSWLLAGKGVGAVLSLIYLGLAVRVLKSEGFGEFTLIFGTAQSVAAIVSFQTWQIVIRYGARHLLAGNEGALARLIGFCLGLDIAGAVAGCLIAWGGVTLLQPLLGWSDGLSHAALAFCFVLLLSIRSTAVGVLRVRDRYRIGAMADAATPIMRFIGAVAAVLWAPTVMGFLLAWAVADIFTAIIYWVCAQRVMPGFLRAMNLRTIWSAPAENPGIWRFAWLTNLNSIVGTGCNNMLVLVVGVATGAADAGHYRLAYQLSQALVRVSEMFARAVLPEFARSHATEDRASIRRLLGRSTRLAVGSTVIILVMLFALGRPVLHLMAGRESVGVFPLLLVLGIAAALDLIGVNFEPALLAIGHAGRALRVRLIRTLVLFAGLGAFMPHFGTMGVAVAMVMSSLLGLMLLAAAAWRAVRP